MKSLLLNFFKFLDQKQRLGVVKLSIFSFLNMVLEIFSIASIIPIVYIIIDKNNVFIKNINTYLSNFYKEDFNTNELLLIAVILFLSLNLFRIFIFVYYNYLKFNFLVSFHADIKNKIFENYLWLDYSDFLKFKNSKIISNLNKSILLANTVLKSILEILNDLILFISIFFILIFTVDLKMIIYGSLLVFLMISVSLILRKKIKSVGEYSNKLQNNFSEYVLTCIKNIKIIILESKQSFFHKGASELNYNSSKNVAFFGFLQNINRPIFEIIFLVTFSLIVFFSFKMFSSEKLILILSLSVAIFVRLAPVVVRLISSQQALNYVKPQVEELLNDIAHLKKFKLDINNSNKLNFKNKIIVSNLSFKYNGSIKNVFKNLNYVFNENDIIKISGKTGSGKTTFVEVLNGLHKNYSGEIIADNINIKKNLQGWKKNINYVPQELHLLNDTLENNIFFGANIEEKSSLKFEELSNITLMNDILKKMPEGKFTMVGESNIRLSGGENQRVNIARGLLKEGNILFLDEATNALNKEYEEKIFENILKMKKFKIIFLISHSNNLDKFCNKFINF